VENSIDQIEKDGLAELSAAGDEDAVNEITVKYLGRKGVVTRFLRNIAQLPPEERPAAGKKANQVKKTLDKRPVRPWTASRPGRTWPPTSWMFLCRAGP